MKRLATLGTLFVMGGILMLTQSAPVQAQGIQLHFMLSASVTAEGAVDLTWVPTPMVTFETFDVYRASLESDVPIQLDQATFVKVASVPGTLTSTTDTPPLDEARLFAYFIRGTTADSREIRSSMALANFDGAPHLQEQIRIQSVPPDRATVGQEYRYQVRASSSNAAARLSFQLSEGPGGMTIDGAGLVRWTPTPEQVGWFHAEIRVNSDKGASQSQRWQIGVGSGSGVVQGYVKEAVTGTPIQWVMVKLYHRHLVRYYEYRAVTDEHGFYKITNVDIGTYLVRAVPLRPDYIGQWYDGVKDVWDATPVTVPDANDPSGGVTVVDFNLLPSETDRPHFTVSGIVTDAAGTPIADASVAFARPEFALNASREYGDGFLDGGYDRDCFDPNNFGQPGQLDPCRHLFLGDYPGDCRWVFRVLTNASGEYTATLPQGFYVAFARAPGYLPVFYDGKTDFLSADIMEVNANLTGINFALPPVPDVALGGISGTVTDVELGGPIMARMVAFRDRWTTPDPPGYPHAFFTETDDAGAYTFAALPPGAYYVLALPLGHYAPSFYSTTGPTVRWREATPIEVNGNSISGIDISVKPMVRWALGYTWMHGYVRANAYANGVPMLPGNQTAPLSGALVYALNNAGTVVGYGITGPDGSYKIDALAPGSYQAMVIRPGFTEATSEFVAPTYDAALEPLPATATLDLTGTVSVASGAIPEAFTLEQNYPNPFNPSTSVSFSIPVVERVSLVVYSILGQEIVRLVDEVKSAGTYQLTWDGRDASGRAVTSGVYLVRLTAGGFSAAKKMALVK